MQNPERSAVESFDPHESFDPDFRIGLGEKALDSHGLQLLSNRQDLVDKPTFLVNHSAEVDYVTLVAGTCRFLSPSLSLGSPYQMDETQQFQMVRRGRRSRSCSPTSRCGTPSRLVFSAELVGEPQSPQRKRRRLLGDAGANLCTDERR